jgi:hypothetical protein
MMQKNTWMKPECSTGEVTSVEVLDTGHKIWVRDSKTSSVLSFSYAEWEAFTAGVRNGEFDQGAEL